MKKTIATLLTVSLASSMLFSGCASQSGNSVQVNVENVSYYEQFKDQNISINVYNWGEYISDGSDDTLNVNKAFEEISGIRVNYSTFATNEELYAKLKSGAVSYDVIIPSDYMINRMIKEDMLSKLDKNDIPNISKIIPKFTNLTHDEAMEYSVPYTWGTVGIIYNTTLVDQADVTGWDLLWNEKYADNILMFANSRDTFAIALKKLGFSLNTEVDMEIRAAGQALKEQKPLVQAYVMDEIFDKMISGEAAIAPYYAGDAVNMIKDNPDLAFYVPNEGTNLFVDAVCIPSNAKNKKAAQAYINFLLEDEVALQNVEYIQYSTPHQQAFENLPAEISGNKIAYPDDIVLGNTEQFENLSNTTNKLYDQLWTEILGDY